MKDASLVTTAVALMVFVLVPGAASAGFTVAAPELDPGLSIAGVALLGGTAAFLIERYRRRTK
jgi:hypothetical protein